MDQAEQEEKVEEMNHSGWYSRKAYARFWPFEVVLWCVAFASLPIYLYFGLAGMDNRHPVTRAMDSVVHIKAYQSQMQYNNYTGKYVQHFRTWQGSGCFISRDGVILTARHVLEGAESFEITMRDGTVLESNVSYVADNMDVGFLVVDVNDASFLRFGPDPEILDVAYILGHPFGAMNIWTVTKGIVSNIDRDCNGFFGDTLMYQSDAASFPGNSGGPLLDEGGRIVGVLVGGVGGVSGISYCIPGERAKLWADVFFMWRKAQ